MCGLGLLAGCTSASPATTPNATQTPLPTVVPPTATATPTVVPLPAELKNLPPRATAESNGDGTWKIVMGPANQVETLGTFNPETGYTIALSDGTSINVPIAEIGSFQAGQDSPFQIYNKTGDKIAYAYDAENKVWIDAAKVIQSDSSNPENYIKIQSFDDIANLSRLEKMVLTPFSADTYSWSSDKVILDYANYKINTDLSADYNYLMPLGKLKDLSKSPFRTVSYGILEKGEGRTEDTYIITIQVYNPDDHSFSLLHFSDDFEYEKDFINSMASNTANDIMMPVSHILSASAGVRSSHPEISYLWDNGLVEADGSMPKIKALIDQWLTTRHVPQELEKIPLLFIYRCFQ